MFKSKIVMKEWKCVGHNRKSVIIYNGIVWNIGNHRKLANQKLIKTDQLSSAGIVVSDGSITSIVPQTSSQRCHSAVQVEISNNQPITAETVIRSLSGGTSGAVWDCEIATRPQKTLSIQPKLWDLVLQPQLSHLEDWQQ